MQDKDTITHQHWSLKVGRSNASEGAVAPFMGEIASGIDDLHQSVTSLILTPLRSVATEPEKGCDLLPWIDKPMNIAIPNVTRVIWDALTIWEPRIVLQDVKAFEGAYGQLIAQVYWRPKHSVLDEILLTEISLSEPSQASRSVA